ncbi:MAG: AarF/UbiB family protein [Proteobacteria bacterium]|nr:AarF/UbiB family protein [Pseudomonadota bacterium]
MDLVRTGISLTKTIKNVARFREILTVFSKNGFHSLIIKYGLGQEVSGSISNEDDALEEISDNTDEWWGIIGSRLRLSFEELGPSFVKIGQLLATREDIFPPVFIKELKKLQNKVKPIPFEESKAIVEESLGQPIEKVFESLDPNPIGTASIGVVYKAALKSGERVVVKVRRPGIEKILKTDFEIVRFIVAQIEKVSADVRYLGLSRVINDFFKATSNELNFLTEAKNGQRLKSNLDLIDADKILVIPKVYSEYSSPSILVMDYLDGKPFNEIRNLAELGPVMEAKLIRSVEMFAQTLLKDGFFHADLHGGNFFILPSQQIGIIDFGLMGTLTKKNRSNLIAVLYAVLTHNYDNLVYEFLEVADYDSIPDHDELIRDFHESLSPFIGLSLKETNVTELVRAIISTLSKHRIYLPREWFIIFRGLMTMDGVGRSVNLDLNIFKILENDIPALLAQTLNPESVQEEALWIGKDLLTSLRIVPKHLKWYLREQAKRGYATEMKITGADAYVKSISRSLYFLGLSLLTSVFILVGTIPLIGKTPERFVDIPTLSWFFWGIGLAILSRSFFLRKY